MKFTVLLSLYFKESPIFLSQSLDSIFNQTLLPDEVVLVEDGPLTPELDNVVAFYAARHPEMKVVPLAKNGGLGAALNEGLKHCTHELVARMDTDDVCKPHRFERQMEFMMAYPEVDVCSSWIDEFVGSVDNVISLRKVPETAEQIYQYAKGRCPVNHVCVVFKKSKVLEVGGYQGFPEDYLLWVRMLMHKCKFYNIQDSLVWVRFDEAVLKRRGGWKYARQDIKAQWNFYRCGFLSFPVFMKNVIIRASVRLMPNSLRAWIYKKLLRR